jgi:two-component system, sensor histidine kinase
MTMTILETVGNAGQRERVLSELADHWVRESPKRSMAYVIAGVMLVITLWGNVPNSWLLLWMAAVALIAAWRIVVYAIYRYRHSLAWAQKTVPPHLLRQFIPPMAGMGLSLSALLIMGFSFSASAGQTIAIAILMASIAMVVANGAYRIACEAMVLGTFVPVCLWSLTTGDIPQIVIGAGAVLYSVVLIVWSRSQRNIVIDTMLLRHENDQLVHELRLAREQAETANLDKSRFLAAASHDLRQPMQGLWLFVGNLRHHLGKPEAPKILDHIEASLAAMRSLFDALLNISQLDAGGIKPEPVSHPIQDSLIRIQAEFAAECAHRQLRFMVWPSREWVMTDPALLDRIMLNLVSNAVKYTYTGGVLVGCRKRSAGQGQGLLEVQVWDTGCGIPVDRQDDIFKEFVQLSNPERDRSQGLGLGLSIVKRHADILAAPLSLRSQVGRGSMFSVSLPLLARPISPPHSSTMSGAIEHHLPAQQSTKIRVQRMAFADDELAILQSVGTLCESWGIELVKASDEEILMHQLGSVAPQFVLSDYRLRNERNGLQLIARVRARWPRLQIKAALLTGDTDERIAEQCRAQGIALLYKPISPSDLMRLLK